MAWGNSSICSLRVSNSGVHSVWRAVTLRGGVFHELPDCIGLDLYVDVSPVNASNAFDSFAKNHLRELNPSILLLATSARNAAAAPGRIAAFDLAIPNKDELNGIATVYTTHKTWCKLKLESAESGTSLRNLCDLVI